MNGINSADFFEGGKAIFTVSNPTGEYYTYRISHKRGMPFFVSLLTGSDNTSDYTYLGVYVPQTFSVVLTDKSKYTEDTKPVRVIRWAIRRVVDGGGIPSGYSIQHEGRCCR